MKNGNNLLTEIRAFGGFLFFAGLRKKEDVRGEKTALWQ